MKTHNFWPIRRFDQLSRDAIDAHPVKNGCTYQGRFEGQPEPAECCTEINADGVPSTWESADREVLPVFFIALASLLGLVALIWMTGP